jgi:hypothetical protein
MSKGLPFAQMVKQRVPFDVDELLEQAGFSTLVESDIDSDTDDVN